MNTTRQGDEFENRVHTLLQQQIEADQFYLRRACCRLFRRKGYYSKDRGKNIIFDVSIEATLPGANDYSLLVLVECKSYSHPVGVEELEEFWAKIQQVAGANVKAMFASTAPIQEGGLQFARSRGFAVLRYLPNGSFKWQLKRSASWDGANAMGDPHEIRASLVTEAPVGTYYDWAFFVRGSLTHSSHRMLETLCVQNASEQEVGVIARLANSAPQVRPSVPFVERRDIEARAAACLRAVEYVDGAVDLDRICEWQGGQSGLSVSYERPRPGDQHTLGALSFSPLKIRVFSDSKDSGRARFTLAHELGHVLMEHGSCLSAEVTRDSDLKADAYVSLDLEDLRRMEWQANFFAACLLLPSRPFVASFLAVASQLDLFDRGFGMLYVDDQPVNVENLMIATGRLSSAFNVSRQVTIIRLTGLGYLIDTRLGSNRHGPAGL